MKKLVIVALVSLVTGIASADPASRIAAYQKATGGTNLMAISSLFGGAQTTNVLKELAAAGFTDDVVIAKSTLTPAIITWALKADKTDVMTQEFSDKFLAHCESFGDVFGVTLASALKTSIPLDQQVKFRDLFLVRLKGLGYAPVRAALMVDKSIGVKGLMVESSASLTLASIEELIVLRLAPELRTSDEATLILEKATAGAKKALRAEGKSFVSYTEVVGGVTNVVNPLTAKLAPVVEALNAPLMTGLEGALATCGITVASQNGNRAAMQALSDGWKDAILDGEVAPAQQAPYLAALKVSLGVEAYNAMIAQYNGEK
jgi:hypothetical protein